MAIADRHGRNIVSQEVLIPGRLQYVIIRIDNKLVGFANIYAPNHETARAKFWKVMVEKMLDITY